MGFGRWRYARHKCVGVGCAAEPARMLFARSDTRISLDGSWQFQLDPESIGKSRNLPIDSASTAGWKEVHVPHTRQIDESSSGYFGTAWYRRTFDAHAKWAGQAVRIEFEGVFHSASLWVNGKKAGEHLREGYTAFAIDVNVFFVSARRIPWSSKSKTSLTTTCCHADIRATGPPMAASTVRSVYYSHQRSTSNESMSMRTLILGLAQRCSK
jgi:glycosyl hydrolase family 2